MEIKRIREKTRYVLRNTMSRYARVDVVVWLDCSQSVKSVILPREPRETRSWRLGPLILNDRLAWTRLSEHMRMLRSSHRSTFGSGSNLGSTEPPCTPVLAFSGVGPRTLLS